MRILKISDVYFPRVNGVSTSIRTFAHEFIRRGHQVTLIAPAYPSELEDDFPIRRVPSRYLAVDPEDRMMRAGAIRALLPQLRAERYDLLHIHTPFVAHYQGLGLARRLGIPTVESYHTYFEEYLDKYLPWLPRALLRFAARRFSVSQCAAVDALVVPTQPMLEVLQGYGVRGRTAVIPTGIPDEAFDHGDGTRFRQRHGIAANRPLLLYVGRVAHEKNLEFLLEVLSQVRRQHPEVLLVIAGEGPARPSLERRVQRQELAEQVRFVGYLERVQDLPDCYAAADVFVFASRTETQGLVLLEAMKLGVPVVSTAVMGTAEIMRDGRGGLVAAEDATAFAAQIGRVLADPDLRQRLQQEARIKAREWSAPATAERMLALYESVLDTRRG
jgi:glycosyltransferase involved in cell wall biosynthesis